MNTGKPISNTASNTDGQPSQTVRLPLEFWTESKAIDEGGLEALAEWLKSASNPKLIVIDVWGRFAPKTPS